MTLGAQEGDEDGALVFFGSLEDGALVLFGSLVFFGALVGDRDGEIEGKEVVGRGLGALVGDRDGEIVGK